MSTDSFARAIADTEMQVWTIHTNRSDQANYFKVAAASTAFWLIGETDSIMGKAAN